MGAVSRSLKTAAGAARVFLRRVRQLPARAGALDRRSAAAAEQLRVAQEDIAALRSRGDEGAAALEASAARVAELRDSIHPVAPPPPLPPGGVAARAAPPPPGAPPPPRGGGARPACFPSCTCWAGGPPPPRWWGGWPAATLSSRSSPRPPAGSAARTASTARRRWTAAWPT